MAKYVDGFVLVAVPDESTGEFEFGAPKKGVNVEHWKPVFVTGFE